jgi:hypothetical protein
MMGSGQGRNILKRISGMTEKSVFPKSRLGSALPVAIVVMLLFMILCMGMFELSQMNVSYVTFFERRNVLEQATLSLAQTLADEILDNANGGWATGLTAVGKGELNVNSSISPNIPKMKFTYEVAPDTSKPKAYVLFVRGEYAPSPDSYKGTIWGVSVDIYPDTASKPLVRWSMPIQLDR